MNEGVNENSIAQIKSDFEESSLPYKVDLINFPALKKPEFIEHIKRVGVVFYSYAEFISKMDNAII